MVQSVHYYALPDGTGYGDAAFAYMAGLVASGVRVRWIPLLVLPGGWYPWDQVRESLRPDLDTGTARRQLLLEWMHADVDPEVCLVHGIPESFPLVQQPGARRIGYTVWETTHLPQHWPPLVREMDGLLVPCSFNLPLFTLPGGPPVACIPHIIDARLRRRDDDADTAMRRRLGVRPETMVFYNISSWNPRKAIWDTLHAYLLAFTGRDDVCFVLKTDEIGQDFSRRLKPAMVPTRQLVSEILSAYPDPPPVKLLDGDLPVEDIQALHGAGDCYFSLAHSEGWGIGAFEAGAAGNPVIITGWGGQCDYLDASANYLVNYQMVSVPSIPNWTSYGPGQHWARADIDHAIQLLREACADRSTVSEKGRRQQASVYARFNTATVTSQLIAALDGVHS